MTDKDKTMDKIMDKNTYVYCVNCIYGNMLFNAIIDDKDIPKYCDGCDPYDPEDSRRYSDRPNYKPKIIK